MTQPDTSAWTLRVDARVPDQDPAVVRGRLGRRTAVMVVAVVAFVVALAAHLLLDPRPIVSALLVVVMVVAVVAGGIAALYRWRLARITGFVGAERIVAVVLDEGIVVHGGLVLRWPEVMNVSVYRRRRTGRRSIGDAIARLLNANEGMSDVGTSIMLGLHDWPTIDARATTKAMRRPLMQPVLGMESSATIDLGALPESQVQQVLAAIVQQAQRHAIPVQTI